MTLGNGIVKLAIMQYRSAFQRKKVKKKNFV